MNLRTLRSLSAWALVVATCATAMADEAKAVQLPIRTRWKAGDVATWNYKDHESLTVTQAVEGQEPNVEKHGSETAFVAILKCVEADPDGWMTKGLLWFQRWGREGGGSKDEGLTGVHVEMTGKGDARTLKVVTPGKELTPDEQGWLEGNFGKENMRDAFEALTEPKEPVAVGGTWSTDVEKVASLVVSKRLTVDGSKGTMALKLLSLEGDAARYSFELSLPVTTVTSGKGTFNTEAGSVLTITAESTVGVSPGLSNSKSVKETQMKGSIQPFPGMTVKIEHAKHSEVVVTKGGEMPPVKAADAPK